MSGLAAPPDLPPRQWFAWLPLFRAGSLAIAWPQLGISFIAVALFWCGLKGFEAWFHAAPFLRAIGLHVPDLISTGNDESSAAMAPAWLYDSPRAALDLLNVPWLAVRVPVCELIFARPTDVGQPSAGHAFLTLAWGVAVWSLFGTAICRAAAVDIAKDRGETLPNAIRFAWSRWSLAISAPVIPAGAIIVIGAALAGAAWFGQLPLVGTPLLALLSPLLLLAGTAMAFLALVIVLGWPLMVAAVAVEDCDGFGALSRTYSFLTGRPVYAAWNAAVSAAFGGALVALASGLLTLGLLALSKTLLMASGTPQHWLTVRNGSHLFAQWLLATFAVSLFWSLATVNYLLLRHEVDRKPFEEVAPGVDEAVGRRDLPVVGIPAADLTPEQRARLMTHPPAEPESSPTPGA
jgi:hypothetical protein